MVKAFDLAVVLDFQDRASQPIKDMVGNFNQLRNAAEKAFEFGKEGAAVAQTEESFNRLGVSIQALRSASLGTVDDMTLMSSTLTLTAGASEALQGHLLASAPQLLNIAKAANKLNPTLGDTAYQYESLALGIKRASPMILDNLGLTIKIGQANEDYAAQIGKTVDELTAEEKQIALLIDTLEAGDRLIEQAGGDVESMGDSFAKAEADIKNATDALKKDFFPAIAEVVKFASGAFGQFFTNIKYAMPRINRLIQENGMNFATASAIMVEGFVDVNDTIDTQIDVIEELMQSEESANSARRAEVRVRAALEEQRQREIEQMGEYTPMLYGAAEGMEEWTAKVELNNQAASLAAQAFEEFVVGANNAGGAAEANSPALDGLNTKMWNLRQNTLGTISNIDELNQRQLADAFIQSLADAGVEGEDLYNATLHIYEQMGFITDSEMDYYNTMQTLAKGFHASGGEADYLRQMIYLIKHGVDSLPTYKKIIIEVEERRKVAASSASDRGGSYGGFGGDFQHGGFIPFGGSGLMGEFAPEIVTPTPGGAIVQPITNNTYNVNVSTRATSGTYAQDVYLAQARAQ